MLLRVWLIQNLTPESHVNWNTSVPHLTTWTHFFCIFWDTSHSSLYLYHIWFICHHVFRLFPTSSICKNCTFLLVFCFLIYFGYYIPFETNVSFRRPLLMADLPHRNLSVRCFSSFIFWLCCLCCCVISRNYSKH